jgi:hypothetical protein
MTINQILENIIITKEVIYLLYKMILVVNLPKKDLEPKKDPDSKKDVDSNST